LRWFLSNTVISRLFPYKISTQKPLSIRIEISFPRKITPFPLVWGGCPFLCCNRCAHREPFLCGGGGVFFFFFGGFLFFFIFVFGGFFYFFFLYFFFWGVGVGFFLFFFVWVVLLGFFFFLGGCLVFFLSVPWTWEALLTFSPTRKWNVGHPFLPFGLIYLRSWRAPFYTRRKRPAAFHLPHSQLRHESSALFSLRSFRSEALLSFSVCDNRTIPFPLTKQAAGRFSPLPFCVRELNSLFFRLLSRGERFLFFLFFTRE